MGELLVFIKWLSKHKFTMSVLAVSETRPCSPLVKLLQLGRTPLKIKTLEITHWHYFAAKTTLWMERALNQTNLATPGTFTRIEIWFATSLLRHRHTLMNKLLRLWNSYPQHCMNAVLNSKRILRTCKLYKRKRILLSLSYRLGLTKRTRFNQHWTLWQL